MASLNCYNWMRRVGVSRGESERALMMTLWHDVDDDVEAGDYHVL